MTKGKFEAIEIFENVIVEVDGKVIFPSSIENIENLLGPFKKDSSGWLNEEMSIGIYAPYELVEAILFGKRDYYR